MGKLIHNHYYNDKPHPKYIAGPKTLSLHESEEYNMTVYIFGETHLRTTDCPNIPESTSESTMWVEDFLKELFNSTDVFIDIYFEFLFPEGLENSSRWQWDDLRLTRLYQTLKESNDLVRLHYFDVRTGLNVTNEISKFGKDVYDLVMIGGEHDLDSLLDNLYMKYIINFITSNPINIFWYEQLERNPKVSKELNRSFLGSTIRKFIYTLIDTKLELVGKDMLKLVGIINNHLSSKKMKSQALLEFYYICIPINAIITDAYTLARIFKKFSQGNKKNLHNSPEKPYNVIIYSGDGHAHIYRTFLKWIQFTTKKEIKKNTYKSCIDLKDFPMPFFNSFPLKKKNACIIL